MFPVRFQKESFRIFLVLSERLNETGIVKRERYHEEELVHRGVDRLEAERRLLNCRLGSFLVRVRDNGNLALSIRANKGILHIKLELRDDRWVLGEGPSFGSVSTVVSFYRSHELPIRGAERMLLSSPLLVSSSSSSQSSLSSVNSRSFV
ncbi:unnamed protein product [Anisakis simplex]|uniref:SH2 domain-containing protein n=1 Tax=Anisakis simplex TaxID=6269 RepID=A0A158PNC1_ANISI|nr:unnamed protein product [Anisakis simplex]